MGTDQKFLILIFSGLTLVSGCSEDRSASQKTTRNSSPIPVVNAKELQELVQNSKEPILVEFSVTSGCFRCDDMRPQVQKLYSDLKGRTQFVRLDFHSNQRLAVSLGATVCPSYVCFSNGKPLWTQNYPTSGGLLSSKVLQQLGNSAQTQSE